MSRREADENLDMIKRRTSLGAHCVPPPGLRIAPLLVLILLIVVCVESSPPVSLGGEDAPPPGDSVGVDGETDKAEEFTTDLGVIEGVGRPRHGPHRALVITTAESTVDSFLPGLRIMVDHFGPRRWGLFNYDERKRLLTLNAVDEDLFGPEFIRDGWVAEDLKLLLIRNVRNKGGIGESFQGGRDLRAVRGLPLVIDPSQETRRIDLWFHPGLPRFPFIRVLGVRADGTVRISFQQQEWDVSPGQTIQLPVLEQALPVDHPLIGSYSWRRPQIVGDQTEIRFVTTIDVTNCGIVGVRTRPIRALWR